MSQPSRDSEHVVVVVPDGLAAEGRPRRAVARPSFAFRAVLDHVAEHHGARRILVAPANHFGSDTTEQLVGAKYLEQSRVRRVLAAPSRGERYIDTRGNAALLRLHLEENREWPLGPVILVAAEPHARRARVCFQKEGYEIARVERVAFRIPLGEAIVAPLWYYRHRRVHRLYERLALVRDVLRPAARR